MIPWIAACMHSWTKLQLELPGVLTKQDAPHVWENPYLNFQTTDFDKFIFNNDVMFRSPWTTVLSAHHASSHRPVVVKYMIDCETSPVNMANDFLFSRLLPPLIVPRILFLSEAKPFSAVCMQEKFDFAWLPGQREHCMSSGHVRFVVQQRVGQTVADRFANSYASLAEAIAIGRETLRLLERMHSVGVIHGDIHMGNVAYSGEDLILIDLGMAAIMCGTASSSPQGVAIRTASPWQLQGMRGFRDDVFRVFEMMARLVAEFPYRLEQAGNGLWGLKSAKAELMQTIILFKMESNFFHSAALNSLVEYVRSIPAEDTFIDFPRLYAGLDMAILSL